MESIKLNFKDNNYKAIILEEKVKRDPIFRANDSGITTEFAMDTLNSDYSYSHPDYKQYVFSTSDLDVLQLFSNGIMLPIRKKELLNNTQELYNINNKGNQQGVYIIEYFYVNVTNSYNIDYIENFFNYYSYNNPFWKKEQLSFILDSIQEQISNCIKTNIPSFNIRLITFVNESYLKSEGSVYVPTSGIVLCTSDNINNTIHPETNMYKQTVEKYSKVKSDQINHFEINIIDNSSNEDYYIYIGNEVRKLNVEKDITKEEGCEITQYRNTIPIHNTKVTLDEMKDQLGIYKTEFEATYNNNNNIKEQIIALKNKKVELEKQLGLIKHKVNERHNINLNIEANKIKLEQMKKEYECKLQINRQNIVLSLVYFLQKMVESKYGIRKAELNIESLIQEANNLKMKEEYLEKELSGKYKTETLKGGINSIEKIIHLILVAGKIYATKSI